MERKRNNSPQIGDVSRCLAASPLTAGILVEEKRKKKSDELEGSNAASGPGCRSSVSGPLLLPSLLFMKLWQSSYNFSLLLMELESVEFMILFLDASSFDRVVHSKPQDPKVICLKFGFYHFNFYFFVCVCCLVTAHTDKKWVGASAFDLP